MSNKEPTHLAVSVRARLKNHAERRGVAFDLVMARYGAERFLYRLAASPHRERFVLKGAALFMAWSLDPHRPTRDIDLLSFGAHDVPTIEGIMRAIAAHPVVADGLTFPLEHAVEDRELVELWHVSLAEIRARARCRSPWPACTPRAGPRRDRLVSVGVEWSGEE